MGALTALFIATTTQLGLPPNLLHSVCYIETKHNIHAVHKNDGNSDSLGVCQIKLKSAQMMGFKGTPQQLMDPRTNIWYAGKLLKHQLKRYNGSIERAVIAYNFGSAKHLTTTKYQVKVFKQWRQICAYSR